MILHLQLFSTRYRVAGFHIWLKFGWGSKSSFEVLLRILAQQTRDRRCWRPLTNCKRAAHFRNLTMIKGFKGQSVIQWASKCHYIISSSVLILDSQEILWEKNTPIANLELIYSFTSITSFFFCKLLRLTLTPKAFHCTHHTFLFFFFLNNHYYRIKPLKACHKNLWHSEQVHQRLAVVIMDVTSQIQGSKMKMASTLMILIMIFLSKR